MQLEQEHFHPGLVHPEDMYCQFVFAVFHLPQCLGSTWLFEQSVFGCCMQLQFVDFRTKHKSRTGSRPSSTRVQTPCMAAAINALFANAKYLEPPKMSEKNNDSAKQSLLLESPFEMSKIINCSLCPILLTFNTQQNAKPCSNCVARIFNFCNEIFQCSILLFGHGGVSTGPQTQKLMLNHRWWHCLCCCCCCSCYGFCCLFFHCCCYCDLCSSFHGDKVHFWGPAVPKLLPRPNLRRIVLRRFHPTVKVLGSSDAAEFAQSPWNPLQPRHSGGPPPWQSTGFGTAPGERRVSADVRQKTYHGPQTKHQKTTTYEEIRTKAILDVYELTGDLRRLHHWRVLFDQVTQIVATEIKAPKGNIYQKYVYTCFTVMMRINCRFFGLFGLNLGWG